MHWFLAKQKVLRQLAALRAEVTTGDDYDAFVPTYPDALADALPFFPGDGLTPCGESCRCRWQITTRWSDAHRAWATYATWQTAGDDQVCADCEARAAQGQAILIGIESG